MWVEVKFSFHMPKEYTEAESRQETFDAVVNAIKLHHLKAALTGLVTGGQTPAAIRAAEHHREWATRLENYEIVVHRKDNE